MGYQVSLSPSARRDLRDVVRYISLDSPERTAPRHLGASLLSPAETSLAAVTQIEFADQLTVAATTAVPKADRSLWWALACAGFVVLLVEWWWFQRRPGVA